jgi:hypothetical protein
MVLAPRPLSARSVNVIFDRASDYKTDGYGGGLFPSADKSPYAAASLSLPPEEAKRLKPELKLAFVLLPKEPYLVRNKYSVGKTTVSNPTDVTESATILVADIVCGLVLDGTSKVLAASRSR